VTTVDPDASLRQLCSSQAADFAEQLLARANGGAIVFGEFVAAAHALVRSQPRDAALYLAAMVALDMRRMAAEARASWTVPSPN